VEESEEIDEWADLSSMNFNLQLPASQLYDCGFRAIDDSDPQYNATYVTFQNRLCGYFQYDEW
jgi:hypothetical protein